MFTFMYLVSAIGGILPQAIIFTIVALYLYFYVNKKDALIVFFSSVLTMTVVYTLKYVFNAPRPTGMLVVAYDPSFPSGHTAFAACVFTFVTILAIKYFHKGRLRWKRNAYILTAFVWMCLVGYSRIYLNAHFPVDVLVGGMVGIACTAYVFLLFKHLRYY